MQRRLLIAYDDLLQTTFMDTNLENKMLGKASKQIKVPKTLLLTI